MDLSDKKIALVTDWITDWGGAERVFERLMQLFPDADIYTSVFFPSRPEVFEGRKVYTSFLQKIPFLNRKHKLCMIFRPLAFSRFDFSEYDIVISCASAEAKGIRTTYPTQHICYCHTPTRYLWSHSEAYKKFLEFGRLNWLAKIIIPPTFSLMRWWDKKASQRPDIFIANSFNTQERIKKYYGRESTVIYPFLQMKNEEGKIADSPWRMKNEKVDYLICLGRVVPYKRFDLAIEACNHLGLSLKIYTSTLNDEVRRLQSVSGPTIEWIFGASDGEVTEALSHSRGFLMPQEEDFGIVALEAMSCGTPVIAYGKGGALETIINKETGILFGNQTMNDLLDAIQSSMNIDWDFERIRSHAEVWNMERFDRSILAVVDERVVK